MQLACAKGDEILAEQRGIEELLIDVASMECALPGNLRFVVHIGVGRHDRAIGDRARCQVGLGAGNEDEVTRNERRALLEARMIVWRGDIVEMSEVGGGIDRPQVAACHVERTLVRWQPSRIARGGQRCRVGIVGTPNQHTRLDIEERRDPLEVEQAREAKLLELAMLLGPRDNTARHDEGDRAQRLQVGADGMLIEDRREIDLRVELAITLFEQIVREWQSSRVDGRIVV